MGQKLNTTCTSIGIITYHFALNYGARLQAFALQKYLEVPGRKVMIINYFPRKAQFDIVRICIPLKISNALNAFNNMIKRHRFKDKNVILNNGRIYRSLSELRTRPPEQEAYICGSDQIWNPNCSPNSDIRPYLLDFGQKDSKRLAYAASLGNCPQAFLEDYSLWSPLSRFNSISVRESDSVPIIKQFSRKEVNVCVDPTMLFSKMDYFRFFWF